MQRFKYDTARWSAGPRSSAAAGVPVWRAIRLNRRRLPGEPEHCRVDERHTSHPPEQALSLEEDRSGENVVTPKYTKNTINNT